MTTQIEVGTLRDWLEAQQPVTVLDIRIDEDRAQWAIPGSVHAVIDPSVSPAVYLDLAHRHGWTIRYVLDISVGSASLTAVRTRKNRPCK